MKMRGSLISLALITALYIGIIVGLEQRQHGFDDLPALLPTLGLLAVMSLLSYGLRYIRWHYLLHRNGHSFSLARGFPAYVAGFAFTATPGKAGELVRIRYFQPLGVGAGPVVAAFVFERSLDIVVLLALASVLALQSPHFGLVAAFAGGALGLVLLLMLFAGRLRALATYLQGHSWPRAGKLLDIVAQGFAGARVWLNPGDLLLALGLGVLAWGLTASAFAWLLLTLNIHVPTAISLAIYPLAMLAGAASMIPGGLGSTEVAIVVLLRAWDAPLASATLAAVAIRLATLWFAIACGLLSMLWLERRPPASRPAAVI
ncbi:MAG TPA: lysylphosphatidylglycerol synthase transmembrane domain-containing protein [Moraxellaceae bacterium]